MSDDLEQMLRNSLSAHARQAPEAPDLTQPVIARGRTIRRRRRVAGVTATALAVVGVTGAVYGLAGPRSHDEVMPATGGSTATAITSVLPRAERTAAGTVVLRAAKTTAALPADLHSVVGVQPAGASVVVLASTQASASDAGGARRLLAVGADGRSRTLASGAISSFAVSGDGTKVAYVASVPGDATQVRVRSVADGQLLASAVSGDLDVSAWDGDAVLLTETVPQDRLLSRWVPGGSVERVENAATAVPVPGAGPLYVVHGESMAGTCLRRTLTSADLVCGAALTASVAPDGRTALVRDTAASGATTAVDLASGAKRTVPVASTGAASWAAVVWTMKNAPLVEDAKGWSSLDLTTGAVTRQPLPQGTTGAVRW